MTEFQAGTDAWLAQVREDIIDPQRPIIDPHHHLWKKRFGRNYLLEDLWADTASGHNIVATMFMECRAFYLREGPEYLRPTGETRVIAELARQSDAHPDHPPVAAIIAHADLRLAAGNGARLTELLDQHSRICEGRLRGIRHAGAWDPAPQDLTFVSGYPAGLYRDENFRNGLRVLASRGMTYDTWHFHHQNRDFIELARSVPECTLVLDHFGTPLGVGRYRNQRRANFRQWKKDMAVLASCPNVYAKLGGLAMPDNGFGWDQASRPPDSDEFLAAQQDYYLHTIDCFGPQRCMFESNFPVDRLSISYAVLWNAFKKMTARYSASEQQALFHDTAATVYGLETSP